MTYFMRYIITALATLLHVNAFAQSYLGVATGSHNTIYSMFLNPANIAGCKENVVINLGAFNIQQNVGNGFIPEEVKKSNIVNKLVAIPLSFTGGDRFNAYLPLTDLRLPGLLVNIKDRCRQGFALTGRIRGFNQFTDFNQKLYSTALDSTASAAKDYHYQAKDFSNTAHMWGEVAFSYGIVFMEKGPSQLKAGITMRYMRGSYFMNLKGTSLTVDHKAGADSALGSKADMVFSTNALTHSDYKNGSNPFKADFFGPASGSGYGMDIGIIWTYYINGGDMDNSLFGDHVDEPDPDANIHMIRFAASVTDIGSILYKGGKNYFAYVSGNGYLSGKTLLDNASCYRDITNYGVRNGFVVDSGARPDTKVHMPTMLNLSMDYQPAQNVYIYFLCRFNLVDRNTISNSYYSQFSVVPRIEKNKVGLSVPLTYSSLTKKVTMGLAAYYSGQKFGFMVGLDNLLAQTIKEPHTDGVYLGLTIPFYKK